LSRLSCHESPTTALYPLSLHAALPIYLLDAGRAGDRPEVHHHHPAPPLAQLERAPVTIDELEVRRTALPPEVVGEAALAAHHRLDRKSTRLNSSHVKISYAVFCLKKKT